MIKPEEWHDFITLLDKTDKDYLPPDKIPHVPDVKHTIAKEGDLTWDIPPGIKFGDGQRVVPFQRDARVGERIRDEEMRFVLDIRENLEFRAKIKLACEDNIMAQEWHKRCCKNSIIFFCNAWCWTFHPGKQPQPFIAFDIQKEILKWFVWCVRLKLSALLEKSREGGASWMSMIVLAWLVLFFPGYVTYTLSMIEDSVDSDTEDSLMGKTRYLFDLMPDWMTGGWQRKMKGHDKKMSIIIPETKGTIQGKLSGGKAGRGGRANAAIYDEFAHVEASKEVLDASSSLAFSEIYVSTVRGMNNAFAMIRFSPGAILFQYNGKNGFHWSNDFRKDEKWSIRERAKPKYTEERWAQEQEIQYETSTSGRVYPKLRSFVSSPLEWCHFRTGKYAEYDPAYPVVVGIDFGLSDPDAVVFGQIKTEHEDFTNTTHGDCLVIFEEFQARDLSTPQLCEMLLSKPYKYKVFVGDLRTGQNRHKNSKVSIIDYMRKYGIQIVGKRNSAAAPILEVRRRIDVPGCFLVNEINCPLLREALQQWSYPIDKNSGLPQVNSDPIDNQYSHLNKALAYLCDYLFGSDRYDLDVDEHMGWDFNMMHKPIKSRSRFSIDRKNIMLR